MDEELCADVLTLADGIARSIQQELMRTPKLEYGFYGHSLGAVIAFETARQLVAFGVRGPSRLFVGACRTPEMPPVLPTVGHLSEAEFLVAVQARYGGIPAAVLEEPELVQMILPIMRADFAAYEDYRYPVGPDLGCPIMAFAGSSDPVVRVEDMAGWANHTSGPFELNVVPGDHFFLAQSRDSVLGVISRAFLQKNDSEAPLHASDVEENWFSTSKNL
jgi:surfactin synthase thioesterase subunit